MFHHPKVYEMEVIITPQGSDHFAVLQKEYLHQEIQIVFFQPSPSVRGEAWHSQDLASHQATD